MLSREYLMLEINWWFERAFKDTLWSFLKQSHICMYDVQAKQDFGDTPPESRCLSPVVWLASEFVLVWTRLNRFGVKANLIPQQKWGCSIYGLFQCVGIFLLFLYQILQRKLNTWEAIFSGDTRCLGGLKLRRSSSAGSALALVILQKLVH